MVGPILLICILNLGNRRDSSGEENKLLLQLQLSLPNNMDPKKYFSGYNLKNGEREQNFGYAKNMQFGPKIFTLSPQLLT